MLNLSQKAYAEVIEGNSKLSKFPANNTRENQLMLPYTPRLLPSQQHIIDPLIKAR